MQSSKGFPQTEPRAPSPAQGDATRTSRHTELAASPACTEASAWPTLSGFRCHSLVTMMLFALHPGLTQLLHAGPHHTHGNRKLLLLYLQIYLQASQDTLFKPTLIWLEGKAVIHWRGTGRQQLLLTSLSHRLSTVSTSLPAGLPPPARLPLTRFLPLTTPHPHWDQCLNFTACGIWSWPKQLPQKSLLFGANGSLRQQLSSGCY